MRAMLVALVAMGLLAQVVRAGTGSPAGDEGARGLAERFFRARTATLDPAKIKSLEIRFVEAHSRSGKVIRHQRLARCQGKQWANVSEKPLPEDVVRQLTSGDRIANAGKAGARTNVDWRVDTTLYSANPNFTLVSAHRVVDGDGRSHPGQATQVLREIGYRETPFPLAGKPVEKGPEANAFKVQAQPGYWTIYRYDPKLVALGLVISMETHTQGGVFQRETFHHWRQYGGAWLPTRVVKERYYDPSPRGPVVFPLPRQDKVVAVDTWEILDVQVNRPLKPADLAPTIPDGADIQDERFGGRIHYRHKNGLSDAEFEAVIKAAKEKAAMRDRLRGPGEAW